MSRSSFSPSLTRKLLASVACLNALTFTSNAQTPETSAEPITANDSTTRPDLSAMEMDASLKFIVGKVYGAETPEEAIANREELRKARLDVANKRFVKGCFFGDNDNSRLRPQIATFKCSIRGSNDPNQITASRPASFSYTFNDDGDDSFAIGAATKIQTFVDPGFMTPGFLSFSADWQKNNQQKKEQDNLSLGIGFEFDQVLASPLPETAPGDKTYAAVARDFASIHYGLTSSYNRKGVFGDPESVACKPDPTKPFCGEQHLESFRVLGQVSPYLTQFESKGEWPFYWVFSPVVTAFYDTALNDDYVSEDGTKADGEVSGLSANASLAISPGISAENKWQLIFTGQITEAMSRSSGREADFAKTSRLFSSSLNYALNSSSFVGQTTSNQIIPILSLTYTKGSDALNARKAQDTIVLGLSLKY